MGRLGYLVLVRDLVSAVPCGSSILGASGVSLELLPDILTAVGVHPCRVLGSIC